MENLESVLYTAFDEDPAPVTRFLIWAAVQAGLPSAPRVLDVGCGPGRMLPEYARLGWPAVALEPEEDFRQQAIVVAQPLDLVRVKAGSFETLAWHAAFEMVVALNGSFAYLLDHATRMQALRAVHRALVCGGLFVLDLPNLLWLLRHEPGLSRETRQLDDLTLQLWREVQFDLHEASYLQINEYKVLDRQGERFCARRQHRHAILSWPQVRRLLLRAGFTELSTYPDYTGRRPGRMDGRRMLICARRA